MSTESIKEAAARADEMIRSLAKGEYEIKSPESLPEDSEGAAAAALEAPPAPTPPPADDTAEMRAEIARLHNEFGLEHQRYLSLQGMYQKSQNQIEQLNEILATMQAAPPAVEPARFLSDDDEAQFGSDLVNLTTRAAKQVFAEQKQVADAKIAKLEAELAAVKSDVGGVQMDSAENKYAAFCVRVADAVDEKTGGKFDVINDDPAFQTWLAASPTRHGVFQAAKASHDLEGVLTFFEVYGTHAGINKQEVPTPKPTVDPRLERQVAPGKSRSTPSPDTQSAGEKRQWTRSGIADFYKKKSTYPKETADALERDLFLAQREDRVDYDR